MGLDSVNRALTSMRVVSAEPLTLPGIGATLTGDGGPGAAGRQLLVMAGAAGLHLLRDGRAIAVRPRQVAVVCLSAEESIGLLDAEAAGIISFESRGHVYALLERELPRLIIVDETPVLSTVTGLLKEQIGSEGSRAGLFPKLTEVAATAAVLAWIAASPAPPGWIGGIAHPRIGAVLTALHRDPARSWTVAEMAALAHLSRSAFAKTFRDVVGTTPSAHLARWRMAHAMEILDEAPDTPLKEIAERLGYSDEFALSTAFKRRFGVSPRHYETASIGSRSG
ncbi:MULTISPECIES: helix-turn-helix domain-containing protein [Microbacterium]|uniref:helix-turn-helix domain-containing protein n=1 Tax=Microbacterium TaxID=33882 RepID=UPI0011EB879D|nr:MULTISPECIES: helix-turn-helix domain-containing protein [Microbacterium]